MPGIGNTSCTSSEYFLPISTHFTPSPTGPPAHGVNKYGLFVHSYGNCVLDYLSKLSKRISWVYNTNTIINWRLHKVS